MSSLLDASISEHHLCRPKGTSGYILEAALKVESDTVEENKPVL